MTEPILSREDVRRFEKEGYLIVRNLFSPQEIQGFRAQLDALRRNPAKHKRDEKRGTYYFQGSLLNHPVLEDVVFDRRVLGVVRALLGEDAVHFGDSSAQAGAAGRGFHRDSVNRTNLFGPDWEEPYPLIRVGIYLGEFDRMSGGLKIIPRSHQPKLSFLRKFLLRTLKENIRVFSPPFTWLHNALSLVRGGYNVPTRSGDMVVWNFRLIHSGHAVRLKNWPGLNLPPWVENRLPAAWRAPGGEERAVLFSAYARPGAFLDRYLKIREAHDMALWKESRWDQSVFARAQQAGLRLMAPHPLYGTSWRAD